MQLRTPGVQAAPTTSHVSKPTWTSTTVSLHGTAAHLAHATWQETLRRQSLSCHLNYYLLVPLPHPI